MNKGRGIVLATIIWAIVGIQPIWAQPLLIESLRPISTPVPQMLVEQFRDWQVACPNPDTIVPNATQAITSCTMEPIASAYDGEDTLRRLFGRMIIVPGQTKTVPVFVMETQLGLLLPDGITFQVDRRKALKLAFRSCHVDGCITPFRLTSQLGVVLRRGLVLKLSVTPLDGTIEQTKLSLLGFTKALKALRNMSVQSPLSQ